MTTTHEHKHSGGTAQRRQSQPQEQQQGCELIPRRVEVCGTRIFYRTSAGMSAGQCPTPLVCIPGLNVSLTHLLPMCSKLAPHVAIYALDLPGYGKSQNPPHFQDLTAMADTVAGFIRALGLERPDIFGISFSAQIAACLAVRHPQLVRRLVLSSPTVDPSSRPLPRLIHRWWQDRESEPDYVHKATLASYTHINPLRALYTLWQMVADHIEDQLPCIQAPTLVVRGGCDIIASQAWVEEATCLLPDARLVIIPGGSHALDMDKPQQLADVVRAFVCEPPGSWPAGFQACQPSWKGALSERKRTGQGHMRKADTYVAGFDSASAMLAATARFLHGKGFPRLGQYAMPQWVANLIGAATDALPYPGRALVYTISGAEEGISPKDITQVRSEAIARWAVDMYPKPPKRDSTDSRRRYPAIAIGSSNGAAVHLYAALGIPWLPQTVLIPVKFVQPVDDPWPDFVSMRPVGRALLDANPAMQLHHMHDPNQDRLMLSHMTYFRVKLLQLGEIFERFISKNLEPGGTLLVMECQRPWPTTQVASRQIFQFGAVGGATIEEYFHGDERVLDYLCRYKSDRQRWTPPVPNGERPEAEWGFAPELLDDVTRLAGERGYRVRRVIFDHPRAMSPLVADLYRWWYARRNLPTSRLLVDSFILLDPYWTLRTGSVPYWMTFNVDADADALEQYLETAGPFDEIGMMLFSNGIRPVGQAPISRWRELLGKARVRGTFVGVAPDKYPSDFAAFARYDPAIREFTAERYPLPQSLTLAELDRFLAEAGQNYRVEWREGATGHEQVSSQLAASQ